MEAEHLESGGPVPIAGGSYGDNPDCLFWIILQDVSEPV